jgi:hypothetical protein
LNPERKFIGNWCWLLPLTYLVHIAEEYGGGFPAWMSALSGGELAPARFLALNAVAWFLLAAGVTLAVFTRNFRWLVIAFGTTIFINGVAHLLASLWTQTYSPGLVTGVTLWMPLGVYAWWRAWACVERAVFAWGVALGLFLHAGVTLAAIGSRFYP